MFSLEKRDILVYALTVICASKWTSFNKVRKNFFLFKKSQNI